MLYLINRRRLRSSWLFLVGRASSEDAGLIAYRRYDRV